MSTMNDIEAAAGILAERIAALNTIRQQLTDDLNALARARIQALNEATNDAAAAHTQLHALISGNHDLFIRPRTVVFYGIKLGLQKGKGRIEFDDAARLMDRIRRLLPEKAEYLIACEYAPIKEALGKLPGDELKKIGGRIAGNDDQVLIKPDDGLGAKLVAALIKGIEQEQAEAQQAEVPV